LVSEKDSWAEFNCLEREAAATERKTEGLEEKGQDRVGIGLFDMFDTNGELRNDFWNAGL